MVKNTNKKTANKRALAKKEDKAIVEKWTIEETRDFINQTAYLNDDPERIIEKLGEELSSRTHLSKETHEAIRKARIAYGLDTHCPLVETVYKRYKPLAIEFSRRLVKEYDCKTSSEKALAEIIVGAYSRIIQYSNHLNQSINQDWPIDDRLNFFSRLSKEIDRANRQFIAALTTLKQLKTPSLEINVRTKAAFIAQNQQLNVNPPNKDNPNKNENIKPK